MRSKCVKDLMAGTDKAKALINPLIQKPLRVPLDFKRKSKIHKGETRKPYAQGPMPYNPSSSEANAH